MHNIAIIFTSFMRHELGNKTLLSVYSNLPAGADVCEVRQGEYAAWMNPDINLEYDAGLSAARNAGVAWARRNGFEWCVITADSIKFTDRYDLQTVCDDMNREGLDLVGFDLANRDPWEGSLELERAAPYPFRVHLGFGASQEGKTYKRCGICRNFFIARTDALYYTGWDERLKLREHEDFFWRFGVEGMNRIAWTDTICAEYIDEKPDDYNSMRRRMYGEFADLVKEKYREAH